MAHFLTYSDESENQKGKKIFTCAGWSAGATVWDRRFTERWQKEVLNGPPELEYLHTTNINDLKWRRDHGISNKDAEARIEAAIGIIEDARWLYPVAVSVETAIYLQKMKEVKKTALRSLRIPVKGPMEMFIRNPDFFCFVIYCTEALYYVERRVGGPKFNTVEFIAEEKGDLTKWFRPAYEAAGTPVHQPMKAGHAMVSKESKTRPLEAADMLCWYFQRHHGDALGTGIGLQRYRRLTSRPGKYVLVDEELINAFLRKMLAGLPELVRTLHLSS